MNNKLTQDYYYVKTFQIPWEHSQKHDRFSSGKSCHLKKKKITTTALPNSLKAHKYTSSGCDVWAVYTEVSALFLKYSFWKR